MTYSFNLIDEPWLPCIDMDGRRVEPSLRDSLVGAHSLREVCSDIPLETLSLHKLLLAVLHRVFGPKDKRAWLNMWQTNGQGFDASKLDAYFKKWHGRFDLFDEAHPFFQVPTHARAEKTNESKPGVRAKKKVAERLFQTHISTEKSSLSKMIAHVSSGNTATLFEHSLDEQTVTLTCAQAARTLVTVQNYGPGYQNFVQAPSLTGIMYLLHGDTLFETLLLNLVRYPAESGPLPDTDEDMPCWEQENVLAPIVMGSRLDRDVLVTQATQGGKVVDKQVYQQHAPLGRLDYLTWHNRKIQLFPEIDDGKVVVKKMAWTPGIRLQDDVIDPLKHWIRDEKQGWKQKRLSGDKTSWRDLESLLQLRAPSDRVRLVAAIEWIAQLASENPELALSSKRYRLSAFGAKTDKGGFVQIRQEMTPLPVKLLTSPETLSELSKAIGKVERINDVVRKAAFLLAWVAVKPETNLHQMVRQRRQGVDDGRSDIRIIVEIVAEMLRFGMQDDNRIRNESGRIARRSYKLLMSWGVERQYWSRLEAHFHQFMQDVSDQPEAAMNEWLDAVRAAACAAFDQAANYAAGDRRSLRAHALAAQLFHIGLVRVLGRSPDETPEEQQDITSVDPVELQDDGEEPRDEIDDEGDDE